MRIQVVPAYGRDYKSKKAVLADLQANKDFVIADISNYWDGKPASPRELATEYAEINVRYAKLRKVAVFKASEVLSD